MWSWSALVLLLPLLVAHCEPQVFDLVLIQQRDHFAQVSRCVFAIRYRISDGSAIRRPAELGQDHSLAGKSALEFLHALQGVRRGFFDRQAAPIRLDLKTKDVHFIRQFRVLHPTV